MVDRIAGDPMFGMTREQILEHLDPSAYIGRCPSQVDEFLSSAFSPGDRALSDRRGDQGRDQSVKPAASGAENRLGCTTV